MQQMSAATRRAPTTANVLMYGHLRLCRGSTAKIDHGEGAKLGNRELGGATILDPILKMRVGDVVEARLAFREVAPNADAQAAHGPIRIVDQIHARPVAFCDVVGNTHVAAVEGD